MLDNIKPSRKSVFYRIINQKKWELMRKLLFLSLLVSLNGKAQTTDTLEQNLKNEQTAYYQNQIKAKPFRESVIPTIPSMIGTMIGASLALFGVRWSNVRQWKLEKEKWKKT